MHKLLLLVVVTLVGCANTAGKNEDSEAKKIVDIVQERIGRNDSGCYVGKQNISMTKKNVWEYSEKHKKKLTQNNLVVNEVICDLGRAHSITPKIAPNLYGMPMKPGDRLFQWGSHDTNTARDDVSIMLVAKENGLVTGLARYLPKERTVSTIVQGPDKVNITNGTYTATVTKQ